jgi:hypothetical protein
MAKIAAINMVNIRIDPARGGFPYPSNGLRESIQQAGASAQLDAALPKCNNDPAF